MHDVWRKDSVDETFKATGHFMDSHSIIIGQL